MFFLSKVVYEDIQLALCDIDGKEAADRFRDIFDAPAKRWKYSVSKRKTHQRYGSDAVWQTTLAPPEIKVGTDKSFLLSSTADYRPRTTSEVFRSGIKVFSSVASDTQKKIAEDANGGDESLSEV